MAHTAAEQVQAAHERIVQVYGELAMAALDRGDRATADTWLARMDRAGRTTDVHLALANL